jgi:hypothetical protein
VNFHRLGSLAAFVILAVICLAAGYGLRAIYAPEWMLLDTTEHPPAMRPWAVEADCYSQLARVQRILNGQGLIQNHFTAENWPEGLIPSTTAPFDYAILLLYAPLVLFTRHPLDWAGALVSPALWVGLVLFWMLFRSREFGLLGRALLIIGSTALPAFIWATACGRPRHQSLILALMAMGLTAEYERWQIELSPKRAWNCFAGVVWGLACWTSLFEPLLVITVLVIFNLIFRRRENPRFLISFGIVMLVALAVEHIHIFVPPPQYLPALGRWLATIAEVQGIGYNEFIRQFTSLFFVTLVPLVAWRLWRRAGDRRTDLLLIVLTVLLALLTFVQKRWIYYANLAELFLIVRYCQLMPLKWSRLTVLAIFLFGLAYDTAVQIPGRMHARPNQPSLELVQVSHAIDSPGAILSPWWLSPGLLYFSGHPIVSGSSHCGIAGIVASAEFFASGSWTVAEQILRERKVRWVVVWDDQTVYDGQQLVYPLLNSSRGILGQPAYGDSDEHAAEATVAQVLIEDRDVPTWMHLRGITPQLKLYEYVPDATTH